MKRFNFDCPSLWMAAGLYLAVSLGMGACLGQGQLALESSSAVYVSDVDDLIGGAAATGREGDVVLRNHLIRAIVQNPLHENIVVSNTGPIPYGGGLVDLDIQRGKAADGTDLFGRQGLMYNWGRTARWNDLQIIDDGTISGNAIVELRGTDSVNPAVNFAAGLNKYDPSSGAVTAAMLKIADPDAPVPVQIRQRYTLVPGSALIEIQTWFYNAGTSDITLVVGDWIDAGASQNVFLPGKGIVQQGIHGFGVPGTHEVGIQHNVGIGALDDAYAWQYFPGLLTPDELDRQPAEQLCLTWERASLCATGMEYDPTTATLGGNGLLHIAPGEEGTFLRHIGVNGRDIASLIAERTNRSGQKHNTIQGQLEVDAGYPATGATVTLLKKTASGLMPFLAARADAQGSFQADVPAGSYVVVPFMHGATVPVPAYYGTWDAPIVISASDAAELEPTVFSAPGVLKVFVQNERRHETAARVLVFGDSGTPDVVALSQTGLERIPVSLSTTETTALWRATDLDSLASPRVITDYEGDSATVSVLHAIHTVGLDGRLTIPLPPGTWTIVATHGNESDFDLQQVSVLSDEASIASLLVPRVVNSYRMLSMHVGAQSQVGMRSRLLPNDRIETAMADSIDILVDAEEGGRRDPQAVIDAVAVDIDSDGIVDVEGPQYLLGLSGGSFQPWGLGPVVGAIVEAQPEAARNTAAIGVDTAQVFAPAYNQGGAQASWRENSAGGFDILGLEQSLAQLAGNARYPGNNLHAVSGQLLRDYRVYYDFEDGVFDPEQSHLQTAVQPGVRDKDLERLRLGSADYHDGFTWVTADPTVSEDVQFALSHLFSLLNLGKDVRLLFAGNSVKQGDSSLANAVNYVSMGVPVDAASGIDQEDSVLSALDGGNGLASSGFYLEVTGVIRVYDGAATQQSAQVISPAAEPWIAHRTAGANSLGLSLNDIAAGYGVTVHVMVTVQSPRWARPGRIRVYRNAPVYAQSATVTASGMAAWAADVTAASYELSGIGDPALRSVDGTYKYAEDVTIAGETTRWELDQTFSFAMTTAEELVDQWFIVTVEGQEDAFPVLYQGASGVVPQAISWPIRVDIDGLGWDAPCGTVSCIYE